MITWDFETDRFGPCNLAPEPVCLSLCDENDDVMLVASCEEHFDDVLEDCLKNHHQANSNFAYDMACVMAHRPKMRDLVFDAYKEERVYEIVIAEKLIQLGDTGDLEFLHLPNGSTIKLTWSQGDLEKRLLGIDRSEDKDSPDSWRVNYHLLKGMPASEYPDEARKYAIDDAVGVKAIYRHQQARVERNSLNVLGALHLNARASLGLYLSSCWGFPIDEDKVQKLLAEMHLLWDDDAVEVVNGVTVPKYSNLIAAGALIRKKPAMPYKNQQKRAEAALGMRPADWEPHMEKLKEIGIKFVAPSGPKYCEKPLKDRVEAVCKEYGMEVPLTSGGESGVPGVRFDKEAQAELAGLDVVLDEYIERKKVEKLVTTELPGMTGDRVHPRYDVLKMTSRTSSSGNTKKDKDPAYPSRNIQQIDPRARHLYRASEGHVLCSVDYSAIELASLAQKCLSLFGQSVLADKINAGMDAHAYLGAAIARLMSDEFEGDPDGDRNYHLFMALKSGTGEEQQFFKHYRGLAKPTGLGFPGGLGAARFVGFAKSTYYVDLVDIAGSMEGALELAKKLKAIWLSTFPEMDAYFRWVRKDCIDVEFSTHNEKRFAYISPFGTVRRNCKYTEATNGAALQTPTAEGAKCAIWDVTKALYDLREQSVLYGTHMTAFIHDEIIVEFKDDNFAHERAFELARLMVEGMTNVITDVVVKAEPALMYEWSKKAEARFDSNNRLIPWQPRSAA